MGYMHINNLYRPEAQTILLFKRCYAMEKIHGSSAHISWNNGEVGFFAGGASHEAFIALFDKEALATKFTEIGLPKVVIYGEAYGGKMQGMSHTYGKELKFIAFDVQVEDNWLSVPQAEKFCANFGLEFVHYVEISTDLAEIDAQRDAMSVQAVRNGCGSDKPREGVVLRPLIEVKTNNGERVICKHKGEKFQETATPRKVVEPNKLEVLHEAEAVAAEWVTAERLRHVLDKLPNVKGMENTREVISAMQEDVQREGADEIIWSKEVAGAIGKATVALFKKHLQENISQS